MRLKSVQPKSGREIAFGKLNLLIGPNNCGKSRSLADIRDFLLSVFSNNARSNMTVLSDVMIEFPPRFSDLVAGILKSNVTVNSEIRERYTGLDRDLAEIVNIDVNSSQIKAYEDAIQKGTRPQIGNELGRLRFTYLEAGQARSLARSQDGYDITGGNPTRLLHYFFLDEDVRKELKALFEKLFGLQIELDMSGVMMWRLRVGPQDLFEGLTGNPFKDGPIFGNADLIEQQGDGYRSLVGVVLSLLCSRGRIVILDEPDAHLHPMQARQLGLWIGQRLAKIPGQVLIATHSAALLDRILRSNADAQVVRLHRKSNVTEFSVVTKETTDRLTSDALLSSQRVLESLFQRGVVVCEGDSDRLVYQVVADKTDDTKEVMFITALQKLSVARIVTELRAASVPACGIVDFDILNGCDDLRKFLSCFIDDECTLDRVVILRDKLIEQLRDPDNGVEDVQRLVKRLKNELRYQGIAAIKNDTARELVSEIIEIATSHGLFIVPVGDLEGWIQLEGSSKKRATAAIEVISKNDCPAALQSFVSKCLQFHES